MGCRTFGVSFQMLKGDYTRPKVQHLLEILNQMLLHINYKMVRGFQSASQIYHLSGRRWSANFSANFCGQRGVAWSAWLFPTAVNLGFLYRNRYIFFQVSPHLCS
jgi:hypothetical protein